MKALLHKNSTTEQQIWGVLRAKYGIWNIAESSWPETFTDSLSKERLEIARKVDLSEYNLVRIEIQVLPG